MSQTLIEFPGLLIDAQPSRLTLKVTSQDANKTILNGVIGEHIVSANCTRKKGKSATTVTWKDGSLRVSHSSFENSCHRYNICWTSEKPTKMVDIFELGRSFWYGGAQVRKMQWPINDLKFKMAPFVAEDSYKDNEHGGVQERYWVSSKGAALFVHPDVPLHVGINEYGDKKLRFQAKVDGPYRKHTKAKLVLRYSIYNGPDILTIHRLVSQQRIRRPVGIPEESLFRFPIWTTWSLCKEDVDQEKVMGLAEQIKKFGIRTSQLKIDGDWTVHRGDWEFDRKRFPNPKEMVMRLGELGYRVSVVVNPFSNAKSKSIKNPDLFVKGNTKGYIKWWNGIGRVLDVTSPVAVGWMKQELNVLRESYGITSFSFDGGEACWLPTKWRLSTETNNPNLYTKTFAEFAYELDLWRCQEVRVGVHTQHLPIFVRMMDKDSLWDETNGLRSVIPHALLFGIIGYPFFIPDIVGGNGYDDIIPSRALYLRWVQVCTFMPAIQFSIPPWLFDNKTVRITKKMLILRSKYTGLLLQLAQEAAETGAPIIRPLWWVAPTDKVAQKCNDQFLVGNDILVAPVLHRGAKDRDIYLPAGVWKDQKTGEVHTGGVWLFKYKVTLQDLPHFIRVKEQAPPGYGDIEHVEQVHVPLPADGAEYTDEGVLFDQDAAVVQPSPEEDFPEGGSQEVPIAGAAEFLEDSDDTDSEDDGTSSIDDPNTEAGLMTLLRSKLDDDVTAGGEDVTAGGESGAEAFSKMMMLGKYRHTQLQEEIHEDDLPDFPDVDASELEMPDLPDFLNTLPLPFDVDGSSLKDEGTEEEQLDLQNLLSDVFKMKMDRTEDSSTPIPIEPSDTQPTATGEDSDSDSDKEVPLPPPPSLAESAMDTLYKVASLGPHEQKDDKIRLKTKPKPPKDHSHKMTLWEELTMKLKDRPKFDPELDQKITGQLSAAVQTVDPNSEIINREASFSTTIATQTSCAWDDDVTTDVTVETEISVEPETKDKQD